MVAHRKVHEDICEAGKDTTRNHRIVCQKLINSDPSDISKFRITKKENNGKMIVAAYLVIYSVYGFALYAGDQKKVIPIS
ncbi:hypothetical protein EWB00_009020 [Schistosoma japonicum]|uniref:Uncharacterized protein n=1 Tax=Schistosoma japonicum TaxID=6182 RepID=A0A4Z2DSJ0_SCHJA|nr:hypothetical protein EWB00_009020 [Schistosoma japonicum]